MTYNPLLRPIIVLIAWTLVMLVWMAAKRLPRLKGKQIPDGTRGSDMPAGAHNWPAHNYEHLLEQPTIFYAIVLALALMGMNHPINVMLAWGYVGLRVIHSLVQAITNRVLHRFAIFLLSSVCLMILIGFATCSVF